MYLGSVLNSKGKLETELNNGITSAMKMYYPLNKVFVCNKKWVETKIWIYHHVYDVGVRNVDFKWKL